MGFHVSFGEVRVRVWAGFRILPGLIKLHIIAVSPKGDGNIIPWGHIRVILGLYWGYIGVILGLYWGYISLPKPQLSRHLSQVGASEHREALRGLTLILIKNAS